MAGTVDRKGEKVFDSVNLTVLSSTAVTAPGVQPGKEVCRALVDLQKAFDRVDDIGGGDRRAVGEFRVGAELEGHFLRIRRHRQLSASCGIRLPLESTLTRPS